MIDALIRLVPYDEEFSNYLDEVRELYESSFPIEERRDWPDFLKLLGVSSPFSLSLLFHKEKFAGFLGSWSFDDFCYVEHLAIESSFRGEGLGRSLMGNLWRMPLSEPRVFEVEPPTTDIARRRISFYSSLGAEILSTEYIQPPYRKHEKGLPLYFMGVGADKEKIDYYIATIRQVVYGA